MPSPLPNEKKLRYASFIVHATRGVVRDQSTRRKIMFGLVLVAAAMIFCGTSLLASTLDPHLRPGWFLFYWLVCGWLTITAMLLAIFDLLLLRAAGRSTHRRLEEEFSSREDSDKQA